MATSGFDAIYGSYIWNVAGDLDQKDLRECKMHEGQGTKSWWKWFFLFDNKLISMRNR